MTSDERGDDEVRNRSARCWRRTEALKICVGTVALKLRMSGVPRSVKALMKTMQAPPKRVGVARAAG